VKLIRSKGVGIILVTQSPDDIPAEVLGQLGLKVQHALRAFTASDRKAIKLAAENYPVSDFYVADELIMKMGTGEAMVTVLNDKGMPAELVHTLMRPPFSRMDVLTRDEIGDIVHRSELISHYNRDIDRESAHEILLEKMEEQDALEEKARRKAGTQGSTTRSRSTRQVSTFERIMKSPLTRTVAREVTRGVLGALGLSRR